MECEKRALAFSKHAKKQLKERRQHGKPTISLEQLDDRFCNYCDPCPEFSGVICNEVGCSTKIWCVNRYFEIILDPTRKCPYRADGFPAIE